jgi:hypothetical protein
VTDPLEDSVRIPSRELFAICGSGRGRAIEIALRRDAITLLGPSIDSLERSASRRRRA